MQKMTLKHTLKTRRFLEENHDFCTMCGREFADSDRTHLGYTHSNELVNVGNCCCSNLKETIIRHQFSKRPYQIPPNDAVLWRFMDFSKFVSLISTKTLFFSRADKLDDPFEGAKGLLKNKNRWNKYYLEFFENSYRYPPEGYTVTKSDQEIKREAKRLLNDLDIIGKNDLKITYLNCWHENQFESEAMWKLYSNNMSEGIAIQSTYANLYKALKRNPSISIGRVNYIDYSTRFTGINESFWFKRKSFEHEREIRAIYKDFSKVSDYGKYFSVNIKTLIKKIYVSPTAQDWFVDVVKETMKKYEVKKRVNRSSLLIKPFH